MKIEITDKVENVLIVWSLVGAILLASLLYKSCSLEMTSINASKELKQHEYMLKMEGSEGCRSCNSAITSMREDMVTQDEIYGLRERVRVIEECRQ